MNATFKARLIAQGLTALAALRLIWADDTNGGTQAAWAAFTHGLETMTAGQIQQRLASQGIEIALDTCAELQVEAVAQRPSSELTVICADDKHAIAAINVRDSALNMHGVAPVVDDLAIVAQGGAA